MNSIIKWLQLNEIKGKYFIYQLGLKLGLGRKLIHHSIQGKDFFVPWDQWCFWLEYGPENYYPDDIIPLATIANQLSGDTCLRELGADIGTVSAQLKTLCNFAEVICLEPNPNSFDILEKNASSIGFTPLNLAISDFNGQANLHFKPALGSDHEGYIEACGSGSTQVVNLDHLFTTYKLENYPNILLKIDVEGQEVATFRGATRLLQHTKNIVVMVEIHPDVLTREAMTAEEIFLEAEKHRAFTWVVPSLSNKTVDRSKPFFSQFPNHQFDVIGISTESVVSL